MKTVLFFSQRLYHYYHFEKFVSPDIRFVAILNSTGAANFPEDVRKYFDKIYVSQAPISSDVLEKFILDETDVLGFVAEEFKINSDPSQYRIICSDEFNMMIASKVCKLYDIPCLATETLELYRDKVKMKARLDEVGIRTPRFIDFDLTAANQNKKAYFDSLSKQLGTPFVVKLVSGAASIGTGVIRNFDQFTAYLQSDLNPTWHFEAEEFIEGDLYHCDGLVSDNKVVFSAASEYTCPNLDFIKGENLGSLPLPADDPLNERIKQFSEEVIAGLGYLNNPFHLEVFKTKNDELVFLEVASRVAGINIPINYQELYGINFFDNDLGLHLGYPLNKETQNTPTYAFRGVLPKCKGEIINIREPEFESECQFEWLVQVGDEIAADSDSILDVAARFSLHNTDYAVLKRDFERMKTYRPFEVT